VGLTRFLAIFCVTAAILACGGNDNSDGFTPGTKGVLRVATSLPAPGFWTGETVDTLTGGFEYGIAQEIGKKHGLRVEFIDVPFTRIASGDLDGADIAMAQIAATAEREQVMALSRSYMPANTAALVPSGRTIRDLVEARTLRWAVERDTTHAAFMEEIIRPVTPVLTTGSRNETLTALTAGMADAALLDLETALATAFQSDGTLDVAGQFFTNQFLVIALPKGSKNLEAVNTAIGELEASGRLEQLQQSELVPVLGRDPDSVGVIITRALPRTP
jgi:polar amino acid transport system substrate-binding protein